MAGVKWRLDAESDSIAGSTEPDIYSSPSSELIRVKSNESFASSRASAHRQTRGRGRGKGRGAVTDRNHDTIPGPETEPRTPQRKRARRTKEEMLAERVEKSQTPRATRHSTRLYSEPHSTPRSTESWSEQEANQADNDIESVVSAMNSRSSSFKSISTEPTAPDKSFQDGFSPRPVSEPCSSGDIPTVKDNQRPQPSGTKEGEGNDCDSSPERSQKRSPSEINDNPSVNSPGSPNKRLKVENSETNSDIDQRLSTDTVGQSEVPPTTEEAPLVDVPKLVIPEEQPISEPREADTPAGQDVFVSGVSTPIPTPSEAAELSASTGPAGQGRWRGGFRGGRRGGRGGRGRNGRGRGGKQIHVERDLSPKAGAVVHRLRQRQKELSQAFRKVAATQRAALLVLANRSESRLIRDPKAHMSTSLYQDVLDGLEDRLHKAQDIVKKEYEYREKTANIWLAAEKHRINTHFENKIENVRNEHIAVAQGSFMESLEKSRQAEDEEHTEAEESGSEPDTPIGRQFVRGFDSSFVRDPDGAALHERVENGWEDLVQRSKIGEEIWPQMVAMRQEAEVTNRQEAERGSGRFSNPRFSRLVGALVEACEVAEESQRNPKQRVMEEVEEEPQEIRKEEEEEEQKPSALDALASAALDHGRLPPIRALTPLRTEPRPLEPQPVPTYLPPPQQEQPPSRGFHRPILPQPLQPPPAHLYSSSADPRPFLHPHYPASTATLPPPPQQRGTPGPPPRQIAPAGTRQQPVIPSLTEQLRLPNPFASTGPPHLPAPQGMAYRQELHQPPPYPMSQQPPMHAPGGPMYQMYHPPVYPHLQYHPPPQSLPPPTGPHYPSFVRNPNAGPPPPPPVHLQYRTMSQTPPPPPPPPRYE